MIITVLNFQNIQIVHFCIGFNGRLLSIQPENTSGVRMHINDEKDTAEK